MIVIVVSGLDEFVCIDRLGLGCPPDMRQCGDTNECVRLEQLCNGVDDCSNGEDESTCGMTKE